MCEWFVSVEHERRCRSSKFGENLVASFFPNVPISLAIWYVPLYVPFALGGRWICPLKNFVCPRGHMSFGLRKAGRDMAKFFVPQPRAREGHVHFCRPSTCHSEGTCPFCRPSTRRSEGTCPICCPSTGSSKGTCTSIVCTAFLTTYTALNRANNAQTGLYACLQLPDWLWGWHWVI